MGEGAFGTVYAVTNSEGQPFAIKSYKHQTDPEMENSSFADASREFQRGQTLDHPNIIKSFDLFANQNTNNLVLQFVEGETLFDKKKSSLSAEEAIRASVQFCHTLRYALSLDLLHLDLHGGNIMVNNNKEIMVIDLASFFLSKK